MTDTDMLYMASLEKRNEELEAKVAELEGKHWNECGQIAHYDDELRRTKELLKAAVEDFHWIESHTEDEKGHCCISGDNNELACIHCPLNQRNKDTIMCGWNYEAEALALIGEDTNVPASADDTNVGHKSGDWISCEDRLPNHYEEVLVVSKLENIVYFAWYDADISMFMGHSHMWTTREVTHWMPFPKPPKGGDSNG